MAKTRRCADCGRSLYRENVTGYCGTCWPRERSRRATNRPEVVRDACVHRYVCGDPVAGVVTGVCRSCGRERTFKVELETSPPAWSRKSWQEPIAKVNTWGVWTA